MDYLLGIDAGSSSVKSALFDATGKMVALSIQEYDLITPNSYTAEVDADCLWGKLKNGISELAAASKIAAKDIKGVAVSSQGETFVPVDRNGRPLRKAISWLDNRSSGEAEAFKQKFDRETVYRITGQPEIVPTWTATKILWLKRNEPDVFRKTHKYLMMEDYLIFRLTGMYVGEFSLYPSSLLFDVRKKTWWGDMLKFLGIDPAQLVSLKESGEIVGPVTTDAAKELGLATGTLVVTGAYDHAAGCIGSGNIRTGVVTETTGSCLVVNTTVPDLTLDPGMRVPCQYHAVRDRYFLSSYGQTGGMALKWFRDKFCEEERLTAKLQGQSVFDVIGEAVSKLPAGSEGLLMLPHLAGAACPEFNNNARGIYFGISLNHGKSHFARALMEAIAFMLKRNIELVEELGIKVDEIISIGGGARSKVWGQIKADVLQRPVSTLDVEEPSLLGAAILAGVATGIYRSVEEAGNQMVKVRERIEPNARNAEVYKNSYGLYVRLYERVADLFPSQNTGVIEKAT